MRLENMGQQLLAIIQRSITVESHDWLMDKITTVCTNKSTKDLYLTYSLIGSKMSAKEVVVSETTSDLDAFLSFQNANNQQIARIYLLVRVLEFDPVFFTSKVANIIQVADTGELETLLKFLILLPRPENYTGTAVEALRTNISTIFNAIAYHNPYPAKFFNEQQWNQMYLKTAFMQGDLNAILDIDVRANAELARIIGDYAHERWAASRDIDPYFWRPVANYLDDDLLMDMKRLLASANAKENSAGALCCYHSGKQSAKKLLESYPDLISKIETKGISWNIL